MASSHHIGQRRIPDIPFPTLNSQDVFVLLCTLLPESVIWTCPHTSECGSSVLFWPSPLMMLTYASKFFHKGHTQCQEMKKINACIKPDGHGLTLAPFSPDSPESSYNTRCFLGRKDGNGFRSVAKITDLSAISSLYIWFSCWFDPWVPQNLQGLQNSQLIQRTLTWISLVPLAPELKKPSP